MPLTPSLVEACRKQFPALAREANGRPVIYLDGPAGTQVPQRVIDSISHYLSNNNANHGGLFATSQDSDTVLDQAHQAYADLLGTDDPHEIYFGQNMTSLTFALSRSLSRTWNAGDEVIVTRLDHDANVSPWVFAARDAGATIREVGINTDDCTLDLDDLRAKLSEKTKLVAVGCASNSSGSINPVAQICEWAHDVGALVFLDAVHFAPHRFINVQALDCDFLACSAYKFYGPHVGVMWGRRALLESMEAYKVRPASNDLPGKWMTGTQNHEGIAGAAAAVDYLADLGRSSAPAGVLDRRAALYQAFAVIEAYERDLVKHLLEGLEQLNDIRVWGITDLDRLDDRMPTVSITHSKMTASELAAYLGSQGIFAWHGNYYALSLTETLGLEPDGMVRLGLVHYNTHDEVDRLLESLTRLQ